MGTYQGFDDPNFALDLRDVVRRVVKSEVEKLRPRPREASIVSMDYASTPDPDAPVDDEATGSQGRYALVSYTGDSGDPEPVFLPTGMIPAGEGQKVRIEGPPGARYVAAILTGTAVIAPDVPIPPTLPDDDAPPGVPTGLVVDKGPQLAFLSWDENTEADMVGGLGTYEVQASGLADYSVLLQRVVTSGTTVVISPIPQNAVIFLRLRAIDVHGNASPWLDHGSETFDVLITETNIADDAITTPKLAANAVIAGKIAAGAITTAKLDAGAVTAEKLSAITIEVGKFIQSTGFVAGAGGTGYRFDGNGDLEASNATIRGDVIAETFLTDSDPLANRITISSVASNKMNFETDYIGESFPANVWSGTDGVLATWLEVNSPGDSFTKAQLQLVYNDYAVDPDSSAILQTHKGYVEMKALEGSVYLNTPSGPGHVVGNVVSLTKPPFARFGAGPTTSVPTGTVTGKMSSATPSSVTYMPPDADFPDIEGAASVYAVGEGGGIPGYYVRQIGWYRLDLLVQFGAGATYDVACTFLRDGGAEEDGGTGIASGLTPKIRFSATMLWDDLVDFARPRIFQSSGGNQNVQILSAVMTFVALP
jgi:hypothetical protein